MKQSVLAALLVAVSAFLQPAAAQPYPAKVVRMVVPFPPGGGFDGIARPFAEKLGALLGQPIVLDFRPGAGGNIGIEHAARSPANGYTLLIANVSMTTNPSMWKTLNYDAVADFAPITRIGAVSSALAVHPLVPARDLKELMAYSKTKALNFASPGVGTSSHLIGEMMNNEGILRLVHIPYKGTAPAVSDAIGGQLDAVMVPLVALVQHIRSGNGRPRARRPVSAAFVRRQFGFFGSCRLRHWCGRGRDICRCERRGRKAGRQRRGGCGFRRRRWGRRRERYFQVTFKTRLRRGLRRRGHGRCCLRRGGNALRVSLLCLAQWFRQVQRR